MVVEYQIISAYLLTTGDFILREHWVIFPLWEQNTKNTVNVYIFLFQISWTKRAHLLIFLAFLFAVNIWSDIIWSLFIFIINE